MVTQKMVKSRKESKRDMNKERADEIVRMVMYRYIDMMEKPKDSIDAFYVGRIIGMMQRQLEIELAKEVEKESED